MCLTPHTRVLTGVGTFSLKFEFHTVSRPSYLVSKMSRRANGQCC